MEFDLVIQNGTLATAADTVQASIGIRDGRIAAIGNDLTGAEVVDAGGLLVLPGFIDPHVHLDMPTPAGNSSDDWFTGTRAAALGGTTTVIDFVEPEKGETLLHALDARRDLAASRAVIDFTFHMTIDRVDDKTLDEIPEVIKAGLTSFKCYTTYNMKLDDDQLLSAMKASWAGGRHCSLSIRKTTTLSTGCEPNLFPRERQNRVFIRSAARQRRKEKLSNGF